MARQFSSLCPNINDMSDDQLHAHIQEIKRRKYIERPAAAKRERKAAKPKESARAAKIKLLIHEMTPAERAELVALVKAH